METTTGESVVTGQSLATYSRNILLRLVLFLVVVVALLYLNREFLFQVYFDNQLTRVGWFINTGILMLFLLGLTKVTLGLVRYQREEGALADFLEHLDSEGAERVSGPTGTSLIGQRLQALRRLHRQNAPINHSALASMVKAGESIRLSFPRFINNILILTGVFGTIVSLSIALVGASNLLDSSAGMGNMGMVIHGMSTALSTTITAIVCYLFYGYFYLKLLDAQTHLITALEQTTALYLLPRYAASPDTLLQNLSGLVQGLRQITEGMQGAQQTLTDSSSELTALIARLNQSAAPLDQRVETIEKLLREGFRLPAAGAE